jgi:hypothetical protein
MLRHSTIRSAVIGGVFGTLALVASARPASAQADGPPLPLHLTAFAVNMSGDGPAWAGTVDITIERWSPAADHDRLLDVLVRKGPEKLLSALQDSGPRAGYISAPGQLGWDIHHAEWQKGEDGGYRVVFATDRPISVREAIVHPRSRDYEFMLCEIRMGGNGVGKGTLATLARVSYDKKKQAVKVENYGIEPLRLTQVRVSGT